MGFFSIKSLRPFNFSLLLLDAELRQRLQGQPLTIDMVSTDTTWTFKFRHHHTLDFKTHQLWPPQMRPKLQAFGNISLQGHIFGAFPIRESKALFG